jgi:ATP-binding cassette subfamily B (MDR/TAP) protein 1
MVAIISAKMQHSLEAQHLECTKASRLAYCAISSIDAVKYFNGQEFEVHRYAASVQIAARWYLKEARSTALQIGCVRLITFGMFIQGLWYGSSLVAVGKLPAGSVLTTFWACFVATQSIEEIVPQMAVLEKGRAAGAALKSIFGNAREMTPVIRNAETKSPEFCEGDIQVRNVSRNAVVICPILPLNTC